MTTNELPREPNELDRLVAAARDGDRPAFDELVRRTYVDTYTLAVRLTAHEEDARDVVQEPTSGPGRALQGFRGDAQFSTWLYRITANTAYTTVKRRRRHRAELARRPARGAGRDPHRGAARGVAETSRRRWPGSRARSTSCPRSSGLLVVLKDVYGLPHEEIAEELGISVSAAKVRLHRGRKRLRDLVFEDAQQDGKRWAHAV